RFRFSRRARRPRAIGLMPKLDIDVSADLQEMFDLPDCADVSLPKPRKMTLRLPGGGTLSAFSDLSKGIPTDCALTFSLLMQLGPFLASIECLVKVLKLIQTGVEVLTDAVKQPPKLPGAIGQVLDAAKDVVGCAISFTPPGGLGLFIHDLLCLIIKV